MWVRPQLVYSISEKKKKKNKSETRVGGGRRAGGSAMAEVVPAQRWC